MDRFVKRAHGTIDIGGLRNDVIGTASVDLRHRNHKIVTGKMVATNDALQRHHHGGRRNHRIASVLRIRTVPPLPFKVNFKRIYRSHQRSVSGIEPTRLGPGRIVQRIEVIDIKLLKNPFLHHNFCAAASLFCGLEN